MNRDLPRYPAFEPTESEWLGNLPKGWKAIRLSRLNNKLTNGFVGPTRDILVEEGVRYLQSLHIKGGRIVFNTPYFVSEKWSSDHSKSILKEGDVLIVQTGDIGQVAAVTKEFSRCNCHALIIVSTKRTLIDGFFLSAVLRSHYGFHSLRSAQTGALHPHLNCTIIRDLFIPVPPLGEQRAILAFLDQETAKIDRLMSVRREQIDCLTEQRATIIHHAVTKGLTPDAKMKPSSIEWLGDIPERWDVKPLWAVAKIRFSNVDKKSFPEEKPVQLCNYIDVYKNERIDDTIDFMEATASESEIKAFKVLEGDVLITKDSENPNDIAVPAIVTKTTDRLVCGYHLAMIRVKGELLPSYLFRLFQSKSFSAYFSTKALGVTRFGLSQYAIRRCATPVPPLEEQEAIVTTIERETGKLDNLITKYTRELELLEEYRASLISHAVTGRIDVRSLVDSTETALAGVV